MQLPSRQIHLPGTCCHVQSRKNALNFWQQIGGNPSSLCPLVSARETLVPKADDHWLRTH